MATEQMKSAAKDAAQTVDECEIVGESLVNSLALKLQGIVNPTVQGGITNYERTFFTDAYTSKCSETDLQHIDQLKDIIASQIPILEKGLFVHAKHCKEEQRSFHEYLVKSFEDYRARVEQLYGKKASLLPPDSSIHIIRPRTITKHYSVDYIPEDKVANSTLPRSVKKDSSQTLLTVRNVAVLGTVPRRNNKRKPTQSGGNHSFTESDIGKRLSNTSVGSNNSVESVQTMKNGPIMEIGETVSPQRPLRPAVSSVGPRRSSNSQPFKDRQPSAVFHRPYTSSFDEDVDDLTPVTTPIIQNAVAYAADSLEKAPPLPPRPRKNSSFNTASSYSDQINSATNLTSLNRPSQGHNFVVPRKNKPLPPPP